MMKIGSEHLQTALPTPAVTEKPAAASDTATVKTPRSTDLFERHVAAGELFQTSGAGKAEVTAPLDHAVSNLGQTLGRLDSHLGLSKEGSLSGTLQTLWKDARLQQSDAGFATRATALTTVAQKSLAALDGAPRNALTGFPSGNLLGDITMVLFEFQKMAGKEAREDNKTSTAMKELVQNQKAARLDNANKQIDQQMSEANAKADNLMQAASTSLAIGIAAGAAQVIGGISGAAAHTGLGLQALAQGIEAGGEAQDLKRQSNRAEVQAAREQAQADKADESEKSTDDVAKTMKDAIRKLLEEISEINRASDL